MPGSLAILGPGGVGGFLAAALERAGDPVVLVAREETAEVIERDGLELSSVRFGELRVRPRAVAALDEPVDVLLVATKATGLEAALKRVRAAPGLVVPLLNGLDHVALLRERYGPDRVGVGTIRIEADRPQPGRIVHTSPFLRVDLASDRPAPRPALAALADRLGAADVPAQVLPSEAAALWGKLVRLNALACTTSAFDLPIGPIREDAERRAALAGAVAEGAAVAAASGAPIAPGAVMDELDAVHPTLGSSMQRDLRAGRAPELDAIPGAVLRAGARHAIDCPTIAGLVGRIVARWGLPASRGTMAR